MSRNIIDLTDELYQYLQSVSVRENPILRQLREETASLKFAAMQISPVQGQFMALLVKVLGARRIIELGVFTGYSSISMALAMPEDGRLIACDVNEEYTNTARRYWELAGVDDQIELRLAPALDTLENLLDEDGANTFDFMFVDAVKEEYQQYLEYGLKLLRPGGVIGIDNVLWGGSVINPEKQNDEVKAIRAFNSALLEDERVDISMLPVGDGLTPGEKAMKPRIKDYLESEQALEGISLQGWVRTRRDSKEFSFIELNDGSCLANIQVIADATMDGYEKIREIATGAAIRVSGTLVESPGKGQKWEVQARAIELLGSAPEDFPLQKKRHSDEFLRSIAHLRPRTNKYGALFRIRSSLSHAVHRFFQDRDFQWIHTPIITGADCEGAGEMFRVTTLDPGKAPMRDDKVDYSEDFFGKESMLTVSGQLSVESFCQSLGNVYTFGPTFRAENSNTSRHIAEFWMIEPEMAFADLEDDMTLGEEMIRYLVEHTINECSADLELFAKFVDKNLMQTLENIISKKFVRLSYTEAIDILKNANTSFEFEPAWGKDLQSEHERYLTEQHFRQAVIVYDYPKDIKAFYMRLNDDNKTVAAMDVLVPSIGEIIGGSQREERQDYLLKRIQEMEFNEEDYWWYLELRKYGTAPHAGFGLGFERLLMLLTGVSNIRDVILFPRTPRHLEF